MVSQAKGGCKECGSMTHTKSWHNRKPIKRTAIKLKHTPLWEGVSKKDFDPVSYPPKPKRKKRSDRAKAKDKAWDAFSMYIRVRDCMRFTGDPEQGLCITCKTPHPRKELQAGHFIGGRGNAVLFREDLVFSQCAHCNQKPPMGLGGNYVKYTLFMLEEGYTTEQIEEFTRLKGTTKVYKTHDFIEIEQRYKEKTQALLP